METGESGKTVKMSLELCFPVKKWGGKYRNGLGKLLGMFLEEGNIPKLGNVVSRHFRRCSFWD